MSSISTSQYLILLTRSSALRERLLEHDLAARDRRITDGLAPVDHDGRKLHDARSLHAWLGIGRNFSTWFRQTVRDYGFEDGVDYCSNPGVNTGRRGKPRKDYLMTPTMAKEVAMIGNTPVGRSGKPVTAFLAINTHPRREETT